ncbi:MAG TPA: DUF1501 domain-containing protein [Kofleriaceae bacterium]
MNRRDLFKYTGAAAALGMLSPARKLVAAESTAPKRLVMVLAQGGWDVTYALDPKVQNVRCDVPVGAIRRFGNLDIFTDASRPNVTAFFTKYAGVSAVVRGISVSSVAHQECLKRMSTGTRSEVNPDMAAIVAHDNGNALPLPYLILGDTAYTGQFAGSAGRVGSTNQIIALLDPAQAYQTNGRAPLATTNPEDAILQKYANATADRMKATRGALGYNRKRVDDFVESIRRGKALQGVRAGFGARGRVLSLTNQVELALDALEQDISQSVMLNTRLGWDTHDANTDQAGFHETTFAGLTLLLDGLAARPGRQTGTTMLDDTIVVCYSEFSRTPKLNAVMGKDHWPVTSALVMGAGVKGGRGYGATNEAVEAETVDFATGARSATGMTLMSNHFCAGVLKAAGIDPIAHLGPTEVFSAFVA